MFEIDMNPELEKSPTADQRRDAMPHFYLPAMPPLGWIRWLQQSWEARAYRRKLRRLLDYDDHMLDDMGHSRAELKMALNLPLQADARRALRRWRAERRRTG